MKQPLTEKYRPKDLCEVTGNPEVMECLRAFKTSEIPNMLFYGPPGTGKTTAIRALLRDLPPQNVMEMNASDERGIDVVREIIKEFSQTKSDKIKVVVLDEADNMSRDAQGALRRIMEDYENTRFCLICNYAKKIIEPIASRCTRFRFSPVNEASRIRDVCLREGIEATEDGVAVINEYSGGDMRKVMNDIQGVAASYSVINKENVLEFFGLRDKDAFVRIFDALNSLGFDTCRSYFEKEDIDCSELISGITEMLAHSKLPNKRVILKELAVIEKRLLLGCADKTQLNAIISAFVLSRDS